MLLWAELINFYNELDLKQILVVQLSLLKRSLHLVMAIYFVMLCLTIIYLNSHFSSLIGNAEKKKHMNLLV